MELDSPILLEYIRLEPYLRRQLFRFLVANGGSTSTERKQIFHLSFSNFPQTQNLRDLRTLNLGKLVAFSGTVTRTTEVRPELVLATFICLMCNTELTDIEQQYKYTEPKQCTRPGCNNTSQWLLVPGASIFTDFQKLRVQEDAGDIPAGCMPRSIEVVLRDDLVDIAKPGDKCSFSGALIVLPDIAALKKPGETTILNTKGQAARSEMQINTDGVRGLKELGQRDLNYRMIFVANYVQSSHNAFNQMDIRDNDDELDNEGTNESKQQELEQMKQRLFSSHDLQEIYNMSRDPNIYHRLASSICPTVCGHDEVKKGILLMLFGGIYKKTIEGIKLRGDINICIVGDPSTAKSQFLKYVSHFLPRSIYTSGKASSAAGLTASVSRDQETGEYCIEAGALMLADHGICCIDEFDKMDKRDQVAIHEAMEQQTISIAKAGIQATLNARASILAAANPLFGRYDKSRSLKYNLDISAPILSRFDLFFVVIDQCNDFVDDKLARFIVNLHMNQEQAVEAPYSTVQLQRYIRFSRTIYPTFTKEAAIQLQQSYVRLRTNDVTASKSSYRITVRQLESLIRLSEALARLFLSRQILPDYVREAERLLSNSIIRIERPDLQFEDETAQINVPGSTLAEQQLQEATEQEKKKKQLRLTYEEYNRISRILINYIRTEEQNRVIPRQDDNDEMQLESYGGVVQQTVVEAFLVQNLDYIRNEEDALLYEKIGHSVIQRLIEIERILIVVQENENPKMRRISVHANYVDEG